VNDSEGEDQHSQQYEAGFEELLACSRNLLDSRGDQKITQDFDEAPEQALSGFLLCLTDSVVQSAKEHRNSKAVDRNPNLCVEHSNVKKNITKYKNSKHGLFNNF